MLAIILGAEEKPGENSLSLSLSLSPLSLTRSLNKLTIGKKVLYIIKNYTNIDISFPKCPVNSALLWVKTIEF